VKHTFKTASILQKKTERNKCLQQTETLIKNIISTVQQLPATDTKLTKIAANVDNT
jgi:hypothetical protein